jgi:hypothetical protein
VIENVGQGKPNDDKTARRRNATTLQGRSNDATGPRPCVCKLEGLAYSGAGETRIRLLMRTHQIAETIGLMSSYTQVQDYELLYTSNTWQPVIGLINSQNWFAQLVFYPNGTVLPPDASVDGQTTLNYHLDDFANCYALLRHEETVYLLYNGPESTNMLTTWEKAAGTG